MNEEIRDMREAFVFSMSSVIIDIIDLVNEWYI